MDKLSKVRADIERLIEQTKPYLGACAGQVVAEANSKIAAYNDVLCILDSMQKEPEFHKPKITLGEATGKLKELLDNMKDSAAKDLGLSEEDYNKAIDECLYGKEPELVDDGDLPKEEPIPDIVDEYFGEMLDPNIQYASREAGIKAHAKDYSFNIESELFQQLTPEQQKLWRKEIEQAVLSGRSCGLELAKDKRYDEEPVSEDWVEELRAKLDSLSKEDFKKVFDKYVIDFNVEPASEDCKEAATYKHIK